MRQRIMSALRRSGNELALARGRAASALTGVGLDFDIHPHAQVSPRMRLQLIGSGTATVRVGPGAIIEDGATLRLAGGSVVEIGPESIIRTGCVLNVGGRLELHGQNQLSWFTAVHCAERVILGEMSGTSEHVTIVDSTHFRTDDDAEYGYHNSVSCPVVIGRHCWIASKATILYGVSIGDDVTISAGSLVAKDLPSQSLVAGMPARVIRQPWTGRPSDKENTALKAAAEAEAAQGQSRVEG